MTEKTSLAIPGAIVIAGLLIAGAVFYTNQGGGSGAGAANNAGQQPQQPQDIVIAPITDEDHIRGNPEADVLIVEYSDLECPFCKSFHTTLQRIMDEYGRDGRVAWVYRHFPLEQLHAKAQREAEATECAAELGGNTAFWEYTDRIFEITPSNDGLDLSLLPQIAEDIGLDRAAFAACLESGRHAQKVQNQYQEALDAGGRGTPYSVIVVDGEVVAPLSGAQPYSAVKSVIDQTLAQSGSGTRAVPAAHQ